MTRTGTIFSRVVKATFLVDEWRSNSVRTNRKQLLPDGKQTKKGVQLMMDAAATRWPAAGRGDFTRSSEPAPVKHRSSRDNDKSKLPFATATLAGNTVASTDAELQGSSFSRNR